MPKKLNFLGGQQNYDADNGQYLPELKGPNGETPTGFKSFKKPKSEFETANEKRLGKVKSEKQDFNKQKEQKEIDYTDEEISEELADMEWTITGKETAGDYAKNVAEKMGISKDKVFAVLKKENPNITEDMKMSKIAGFDDEDEVEDEVEEEKKEQKFEKPQGFDNDQEEFDYNYNAAKKLNNYEQAEKLKGMLAKNYGENSNAVKGVQKALDEMKANFDKGNKEKTLDDYTDDLFKETNLKTFTSKKYKAKDSGDIIEVRLFGKDSAIRYNETKNIVEQVWLKGKKVK